MVCLVTGSAYAQEAGAISSPVLSRCAGKFGTETRTADPAFVSLALDGAPWLTIEKTNDTVGSQPIFETVTGTGDRRRRDGTVVPFRFTCVLDFSGQALMFHVSPLMRRLGDDLPPATIVEGAATYLDKMPLPRGIELQVQLLDISKSAAGERLAEQVVRSGWQVPVAFALRVPKETSLAGRKLVITARFVVGHQVLFQLKEPRAVTGDDLHKLLALTLDKV
jgi:hypothetical protein